jgi:hypothetical protein
VWEPTHRRDLLYGNVSLGSGVVGIASLSDSVNLLVGLCAVVIPELSDTPDAVLDLLWMPGTDTRDLSTTTMGLLLEHLHAPSLDDTSTSLTLGHTDSINQLVWLEDLVNADLLLHMLRRPVNLRSNIPTVKLDLHDVGFLESEVDMLGLRVADDTYNLTVLLDTVKRLADSLFVVLLVLGKCLLLGSNPVAVEPSLALLAEMLCPCGDH